MRVGLCHGEYEESPDNRAPAESLKEEGSFLKKRTKKLLPVADAAGSVRDSQLKVFCFFSSEKKTFLLPSAATPSLPVGPDRAYAVGRLVRVKNCSFLKKRTKKLLHICVRCRRGPRQPVNSLLLLAALRRSGTVTSFEPLTLHSQA
jgi:hypothetical protein